MEPSLASKRKREATAGSSSDPSPVSNIAAQLKLKPVDVMNVMKADKGSGHQIDADASLLMAVAAELFVGKLAEQAWKSVKQNDKGRTEISYDDVVKAREGNNDLAFLEEALP